MNTIPYKLETGLQTAMAILITSPDDNLDSELGLEERRLEKVRDIWRAKKHRKLETALNQVQVGNYHTTLSTVPFACLSLSIGNLLRSPLLLQQSAASFGDIQLR
jgi:hypothetical protein